MELISFKLVYLVSLSNLLTCKYRFVEKQSFLHPMQLMYNQAFEKRQIMFFILFKLEKIQFCNMNTLEWILIAPHNETI